jgi:hypothetical protein
MSMIQFGRARVRMPSRGPSRLMSGLVGSMVLLPGLVRTERQRPGWLSLDGVLDLPSSARFQPPRPIPPLT